MPNPANGSEAIAGRLLGTDGSNVAALAALIGTRVFPTKPTQEQTGDYLAFWRTGGGDGMRLSSPAGLRPVDVRVECRSATEGGAEAILREVVALLHGWSNRTIGVQGCFAVGDSDEETDPDDGRQVSGQTFQLWFKAQ